eukprot:m.26542 g.26542  ORF g.26542 m.26542 type:complete len:548 (-) comp15441_c0_seq1:72-1715(-)
MAMGNMVVFTLTFCFVLVSSMVAVCGASDVSRNNNILMIVVDDLRAQLGAYGLDYMHTPHLDKMAAEGVLFERAYVQQAICSPTRNSFLSGRYPDKTKTWNFIDDFREVGVGDKWTALPEFFRDNGYFTTGAGKVYHPNKPPNNDQNRSWSEEWLGTFGSCPCGGHGWPPKGSATCENVDTSATGCEDDNIVIAVSERLRMAANGTLGDGKQPWLIAAGFHKPHLPFYAPPEFFKLYPDPPKPEPENVPVNLPFAAFHSCLSNYPNGYSNWGNFTDIPNEMTLESPMATASAAHLRRGYFASVSYTDSNIGKLLAAAAPVLNTTVVVVIGDHGWSLGEQNEWCKMTNFENGVQVPLIFRPPNYQHAGARVTQLAEAVDLYKTLADLSGLGVALVEDGVDGISLMPVIQNPNLQTPLRNASRSQFPRCYNKTLFDNITSPLPMLDRTDCQDLPKEDFDLMGYSIRTDSWRFTEWRKWDGQNLVGLWDIAANGTEMYFHGNDTHASSIFATETENVAGNLRFQKEQKHLSSLLRSLFFHSPTQSQAEIV